MKNKFRILTSAITVAGSLAAVYLVAEPAMDRLEFREQSQQAESREQQHHVNQRRVLAPNIQVDPAGDRQLLMAIARLEQRDQIAARLQYEGHLQELRIDGRGEYLQQGRGDRRHVRWLLESRHDGLRASLLQSTDGRFLWTDRTLATERHIERVDLWQLRRQQKKHTISGQHLANDPSSTFANQLTSSVGGLPMMLESLRKCFEFTAPGIYRAPPQLHLGDQPVIGLIGRWRSDAVASVLADLSDVEDADITAELLTERLQKRLKKKSLPEWMPMNVLLLLGKDDLFPYLIEYRSGDDPLAQSELGMASMFQLSSQPLARLKMQDVQFDRDISSVEFIYEPPAEPAWFDRTNQYVDRLQRAKAIQVAQQQARRMANEQAGPRR